MIEGVVMEYKDDVAMQKIPTVLSSTMASERGAALITSEAYTRCLSAGIDPHGPHPNDFDTDDGEKIAFSGESKFALWAAAQSEPAVGLKKKSLPDGTTQPTGIDVVMWTDLNAVEAGATTITSSTIQITISTHPIPFLPLGCDLTLNQQETQPHTPLNANQPLQHLSIFCAYLYIELGPGDDKTV
ncbi:hypothetical protein BDD12DRAFT_914855 [Trichophaea hybrida]|nr:hypothetical protein BDD12DRAFT_914855 [Trichophaea hybrida]